MVSPGAAGSIVGTLFQTFGSIQQGRAAAATGRQSMETAEFNAREALRQGNRVVAISQRRATEERRQGKLAASRALAVAAASGAGVSDPTIIDLIARTEGEGIYRANVALYEGEAESRRLRFEAAMGRLAGARAFGIGLTRQTSYQLAAIGTAFRGGASLYSKYAGSGPGRGDDALIGTYDAGFT